MPTVATTGGSWWTKADPDGFTLKAERRQQALRRQREAEISRHIQEHGVQIVATGISGLESTGLYLGGIHLQGL
jgi:hypothetical protein